MQRSSQKTHLLVLLFKLMVANYLFFLNLSGFTACHQANRRNQQVAAFSSDLLPQNTGSISQAGIF
jgi:hypothetical protein